MSSEQILKKYIVAMAFNACVVKFFFFQAEDGIRDRNVTGVQRVLFRSVRVLCDPRRAPDDPRGRLRGRPRRRRRTARSEERRVGKERSAGWAGHREGKKATVDRRHGDRSQTQRTTQRRARHRTALSATR